MKTKFEKQISFLQGHVFPRTYRNLQNLPHWHREHELIFVESGAALVTINGLLFTLQAGESAFLYSEDMHSIRAEENAVVTVVKLDAAHFGHLMGEERLLSPVLAPSSGIAQLLPALRTELLLQDRLSGAAADALATQLLINIWRHNPLTAGEAPSDVTNRYKALMDLIHRNYAYLTFDDAAEFMHFSRPYFSKFFCAHTGMTFTQYLNTIRISFAVELLAAGDKSVTKISQSCGFNTIRNFNRVFKSMTGHTPASLPRGYLFVQGVRDRTDTGFDPTLGCTEVIG